MQRYKFRLLIALVTFCVGLLVVEAIHVLEHAIVKRYYTVPNADISSITVPDPLESNEIYNVILREKFVGPNSKLLVVDSQSANVMNAIELWKISGNTEPYTKILQGLMPEAQMETLDNFVAANRVTGPVTICAPDLNMVKTSRDLSLDDPVLFWTEFSKIYPRGSSLIVFSQVGFNKNHEQAVVYLVHSCGGLCGTSGYVLLGKTNGKWVILHSGATSVS